MSTLTCAACTTIYSHELEECPHCGSVEYSQEGAVIARRLPAFVALACDCGRTWNYRLSVVASGLVQLAPLYCASCGSQVQIPWPPKEDAMPKITRHGGSTNARDADPSPDVDASQPLLEEEPLQEGRPTAAEEAEVEESAPSGEAPAADGGEAAEDDGPDPDYDGMTLAELREEATERGLAAYGTKAQITERLREADANGA